MDNGCPIKAEIKPILNAWAWQKKKLQKKLKFNWDMWELIGQHSQHMFVTAPPSFVTRLYPTSFKNLRNLNSSIIKQYQDNRKMVNSLDLIL